MHISKNVSLMKETLDINYQLLASELDTSVKDMRYLSKDLIQDALEIESFDNLIKDIETVEGIEITSFDDNTVLYEYEDEAIVIHTNLASKYILFDSLITNKIENKMNSFR